MELTVELITFFVLSVMAIGGAVMMINFSNVVHMALSLAFTFFSIAGIYLLLNAEFLAVVQVLIYTGAITILMLFGIMLTRHRGEEHRSRIGHNTLSFIVVATFFSTLLFVIYKVPFTEIYSSPEASVSKLGGLLFTQYVIPFELTSILLLVALVGAVILAKKERE